MGMFSQNRTYLGSNIDVVANESYVGTAGAYRAMCEGYQNSYSIFESCIGLDFMEAAVVNEGVDEYEFAVVQESFVGDFFNKIKEFLLKLLEKIKGIIKSFITKVVGTFTKDGKELVKKYKDDILKKDLSKMKYKYAKPTNKEINIGAGEKQYEDCLGDLFVLIGHVNPLLRDNELDNKIKTRNDSLSTIKRSASDPDDRNSAKVTKDSYTTAMGLSIEDKDLEKINDEINDNTYLEKAFGAALGNGNSSVEMSEFAKEAKEYLFDAEEEETDDADKLVTDLMLVLQTAKKEQDELQKDERKSTKNIKNMISEIEKANREVSKLIPDKGKDKDRTKALAFINKILNTAQKAESQLSTYITKAYAVKLELIKFNFAQCKRIWVQMAAYRPKAVKENALLIEAIGEAAEYEAYSSFTEAEMSYY